MLDGSTSGLLEVILLPLFIGVLWVIAASILQIPRAIRGHDVHHSATHFGMLSITDAFDDDHVILWQSQVPALRLINSKISSSKLFEFFRHVSPCYPELYENVTFDDWLNFLRGCELVVCVGSEVCLTPAGREFLKYLEQADSASRRRFSMH